MGELNHDNWTREKAEQLIALQKEKDMLETQKVQILADMDLIVDSIYPNDTVIMPTALQYASAFLSGHKRLEKPGNAMKEEAK